MRSFSVCAAERWKSRRKPVSRGRGPIPSSGWLTTDPDLVSLQAVPAFNDLVRRLADDEERQSAITTSTPL